MSTFIALVWLGGFVAASSRDESWRGLWTAFWWPYYWGKRLGSESSLMEKDDER